MKQQDIAILIIIVAFAGAFSYFISTNYITPSNEKLSAQVVQPITTEFPTPDKSVFNDQAVNPSVRIEIAPNQNPNPFTNPN
jgi:hypothetical protein